MPTDDNPLIDEHKNDLEELLVILDKNHCVETRKQLNEYFGWATEVSSQEQPVQKGMFIADTSRALSDLHGSEKKINPEYSQFLIDLAVDAEKLRQAGEVLRKREIVDIVVEGGVLNAGSQEGQILATVRFLQTLEQHLVWLSKDSRGRPSLDNLRRLALKIAQLYERLSGKEFTVYRPTGLIMDKPITPGHQFVSKVIELVNTEAKQRSWKSQFTAQNIYTVCESARMTLKSRAQ